MDMETAHFFTTMFTAFMIGLLGSTHCVGMCGGITSALSLSLKSQGRLQSIFMTLCYHLGRIFSYALAGLIIGSLGWYLGQENKIMQLSLRWLAGLMLILMGLYAASWWQGLRYIEKLGNVIWKRIQPLSSKLLPVKSYKQALFLGCLWGWLPCGMVYSTLIWSASHSSFVSSSVLMVCFGLGTLPAVFLTGIFASYIKSILQAKIIRNIAGLAMLLFGIWTIPGAHQMWIMSLFPTISHSVGHHDHDH